MILFRDLLLRDIMTQGVRACMCLETHNLIGTTYFKAVFLDVYHFLQIPIGMLALTRVILKALHL